MRSWLVLPLALCLLPAVAAAEDRLTLLLEKWEVGRATRDGPVPKLAPGAPRLPFAAASEDVIARAVFDLPAAVGSHALVLEARLRWDASVSLDGKPLAKGLEGDVRLDLGTLAPGKHEVLVRARDVRAAAVAGRKLTDDDSVEGGWAEPLEDAPRLAGVLGAARLLERLPVEVRSIDASEGPVRVELEGVTGEPADVGLAPTDPGAAKPQASVHVTLEPGKRTTVTLGGAPRWPERATVEVTVAGRVVRRERVAARKLAIVDDRLTLDGRPVALFIVDAPRGDGAAAAQQAIARAREVGATAIATGGERDLAWLEAVEAAGFLVVAESGLGPSLAPYAVDDPRFWDAHRRRVLARIERERSHPAIVAWGLARGVLAGGGAALSLARERLASLAREVHALDPSRLVLLPHDDARPLGIAPAWLAGARAGTVALLAPGAAPRDLATRVALASGDGFLDDAAVLASHARDRAREVLEARARGALGVDLGEAPAEPGRHELARALEPFVVVPRFSGREGAGVRSGEKIARDVTVVSELDRVTAVALVVTATVVPATGVPATGDPAKNDPAKNDPAKNDPAKGDPAKGDPAKNDPAKNDPAKSNPAKASEPAGTFTLELAPGTRATRTLTLEAPAVTERRELDLAIAARAEGHEAHASARVVVWPARFEPLPLERRVLLVDRGGTGDALLDAGVAWREAPLTPEVDPASIVVVGEGALDEPALRDRAVALVEHARRLGAGVLVLRQTKPLPPGIAPALESQEPRGARDLAFAPGAAPLLAGIEPADVAAWGEPVLPAPGIARPLRADASVLLESSRLEDACGVVSCEDEATEEIVCQVPLVARTARIPAAAALLRALVRAANEPVVRGTRPLFARVEPEVEAALDALALPPRPWSADAIAHAAAPVILLDEMKPRPLSPADRAALRVALEHGATLVVRVGDDASLPGLPGLVTGLKLEKTGALPRRAPWAPEDLRAIDLFWPPAPNGLRELGSRFDAAPRQAVLEGATVLVAPGALLERPLARGRVLLDLVRWREGLALPGAKRYLASLLRYAGAATGEAPIRLPATAWAGVGRKEGTLQFFANATATARFQSRREGRYRVSLELGGTPALGIWPTARLYCDAHFLGEIAVEGPGPARYEREVTIPAGAHVLSLAFTNDVNEPPEDRNMWFDGAVLEPLPRRVY